MLNLPAIADRLLPKVPETEKQAVAAPARADAPGAAQRPGEEVHELLRQQPERREAVYRDLVRHDPGLIHHLERWHQQDAVATTTVRLPKPLTPTPGDLLALPAPFSRQELATVVLAQAQAPAAATTPDPAAEAERVLEAGSKRWARDDYAARLDAYAEALGKGDAAYREQLLAEILERDPGAFQSWLDPARINATAAEGRITQAERGMMAETFAAAYNDGLIPSYENGANETLGYNFNPVGQGYSDPLEQAKAVGEFLDFIDAAGSTAETRAFRQGYAQYLTDQFALNDRLPVLQVDGHQVQNSAATLAALLVSGDAQHPELASSFLSSLDAEAGRLDRFLDKVEAGSVDFTADFLGPRINDADPRQVAQLQRIAQPDALSQLVGAVANSSGADAERLAVKLARAPGDHGDWFRNDVERADAWTALFDRHSGPILDELTTPDGLPVVNGAGGVEPAFKDRAHDLGALLRLINNASDPAAASRAREHLIDYADQLKQNIAGASTAEVAIENGQRLGFLAAAVTDSVTQALQDHARSQAQKQALVGFVLDLAISAIPGGSLAKGALGDWFEDNIGSAVIREALDGFTGQLIDAGTGRLSDEAKRHILENLDEGDLNSLVAKLQESNVFIRDTLFSDLPAPGYEDNQAGRADTLRDAWNAYDNALDWLAN